MNAIDQKGKRRADRIARPERASGGSALPAIGLEAEFTTIVDDVTAKPEDVFGSPRNFIRGPLIHRTGRSYHLPTGGAVYFDTGVIEVATPMIEIARGCGARGTRALWENLGFLRGELDAWEAETGRSVRLSGFSAHYNVSFDTGIADGQERTVEKLAYLLTHILAAPVMLLAANRRSTGIGVRPRGNRIEVTADFTPDAALMAATATLIVGITREVMRWPSYAIHELARRGIPVVRGFVPERHSSRKGWVAKHTCYPANPFTSDIDASRWPMAHGPRLSLRDIAGRTSRYFWRAISDLGDPTSLQVIAGVMRGRARSLLELDDRPKCYDDVGRLCSWKDIFPVASISRSRYERVVGNAIAGHRVRLAGAWHRPVGMKGWTHIVFRRERDGARLVVAMDDLLAHLGSWDRSANRRVAERRRPIDALRLGDRRERERRVAIQVINEMRRKGDTPLESDRGASSAQSGAPEAKTDV